MRWIGLSYSLPSGSSSPRVAVWRRQKQLGAVSPTASFCLLPEGGESLEALEWLAEEVRGAGGEALVLRIDRLEGEAEGRLIELSRTARAEDYRVIAAEAAEAVAQITGGAAGRKATRRTDRSQPRERADSARPERVHQERVHPERVHPEKVHPAHVPLERLRRRLAEVVRIDFFQAPDRALADSALVRLAAALQPDAGGAPTVAPAEPARYRGRRWVTRPRPHVDRLASAWLIRRFIDPAAEIRYSDTPEEGEVSFDMRGAEFGHRGSRCTFETLLASFGLGGEPGLASLAEIVHEIDLRDGLSARPEVPGVDAALRGWAGAGWSDQELERHGVALFEGLYEGLRGVATPAPQEKPKAKPRRGGKPRARVRR